MKVTLARKLFALAISLAVGVPLTYLGVIAVNAGMSVIGIPIIIYGAVWVVACFAPFRARVLLTSDAIHVRSGTIELKGFPKWDVVNIDQIARLQVPNSAGEGFLCLIKKDGSAVNLPSLAIDIASMAKKIQERTDCMLPRSPGSKVPLVGPSHATNRITITSAPASLASVNSYLYIPTAMLIVIFVVRYILPSLLKHSHHGMDPEMYR